ncbi:MAG: hypothetical protein ACE5R7_02880, partial [Nitrosarchaeum sp.]
GIVDDLDSCPLQAETVNGLEDTDGCPDVVTPKDTDGDGIVDDLDSCPLQAETVNGLEDTDGCPDVVKKVNEESILTYIAIGISVAVAVAIVGIKLHGKGSGEKSRNDNSDKHDDNQDSTPHVEVRITGGIEK